MALAAVQQQAKPGPGSEAKARARKPPVTATGPLAAIAARRLAMQAIGNQQMLRRLQKKTAVSQPHDPDETAADRIADTVMGSDTTALQDAGGNDSGSASGMIYRKCDCGTCADCAKDDDQELQRKPMGGTTASPSPLLPAVVSEVLQSSGEPLPLSARDYFEPRFGSNFAGVRIHTDPRAAESARAVNALAYTVGRDVVFGAGRYAPHSAEGRSLLAHELAHVVQQGISHTSANRVQRQSLFDQDRGVTEDPDAVVALLKSGQAKFVVPPASSNLFVPGYADLQNKLVQQGLLKETPKTDQPPTVVWLGTPPNPALKDVAEKVAQQLGRGKPVQITPRYAPGELELKEKLTAQGFPTGLAPAKAEKPPTGPSGPTLEQIQALGQWQQLFVSSFSNALSSDEKLKADLDALNAQLASTSGKAKFGAGLVLGLASGAAASIGDIAYVPFKAYLELGFKTKFGDKAAVMRLLDEYKAALGKIIAQAPELIVVIAFQPRESGTLAARFISDKVRKDLLREGGRTTLEQEVVKNLNPKDPFDLSGVQFPSLSDLALHVLSAGEPEDAAAYVYNKGLSIGHTIGYALMDIIQLFVGFEELKGVVGGIDVLKAAKESELGKKLSSIIEGIPELRKFRAVGKEAAAARELAAVESFAAEGRLTKEIEAVEAAGAETRAAENLSAEARAIEITDAEVTRATTELQQKVKTPENVRLVTDPALLRDFDAEVDVAGHVERRRISDDTWCLFSQPKCNINPGVATNDATDAALRNRYPDFSKLRDAERSTAQGMVKRLSDQVGITIPPDVVEAPWIGRVRGKSGRTRSISTSEGWLRDENKFWEQFAKDYPEDYKLIGEGHTVTPELAKKWGWDQKYVNDKLIHHHIDNGPYVVPVPRSVHAGKAGIEIHATATIVK